MRAPPPTPVTPTMAPTNRPATACRRSKFKEGGGRSALQKPIIDIPRPATPGPAPAGARAGLKSDDPTQESGHDLAHRLSPHLAPAPVVAAACGAQGGAAHPHRRLARA